MASLYMGWFQISLGHFSIVSVPHPLCNRCGKTVQPSNTSLVPLGFVGSKVHAISLCHDPLMLSWIGVSMLQHK